VAHCSQAARSHRLARPALLSPNQHRATALACQSPPARRCRKEYDILAPGNFWSA